jgi:uncharacterized membrane protein YjjP (DUF1212 family)
MTTDDDQTAGFLLQLGQAMHGVAMPSNLVERRLRAAARGLGTRIEAFVLQGFLCVQLDDASVGRVALRRTSFDTHWNLARLADLVGLGREIAAGRCDLARGRAQLEAIMAAGARYSPWLVTLAYSVYAAVVTARVGGRWLEIVVGGLVGILAGQIHFGTLRYESIGLQKSFVAALVATSAALLASLALPPFDAAQAIFGGITLLVPAMVVTVGTAEMANDALESGVVRLAYGLLRFLMLGAGVMLASHLWLLFAPMPPETRHGALPHAVTFLLVAAGGAALTVCMQARLRDLPWVVGGATVAWGAQELTKLVVGGRGSPLVASLALGTAGLLYARFPGRAAGTVIFPGLLQLAPGFLGTEAVLNLLRGHGGDERFFDVLLTAVQLVTGLLIAEVLFARRREPA